MAQSALEAGQYFDQGFMEHAKSLGLQMQRKPNDRIVIIGNGALTGLGDLDQTWEGLKLQRSATRYYPEAENFRTNIASPLPILPSVVFEHFYSPDKKRRDKELERFEEVTVLVDGLSRTLAEEVGLLGPNGQLKPGIDRDRFGLWVGSGIGPADELVDVDRGINEAENPVAGSRAIDLFAGVRLFPQAIIGPTSRKLGARGESGSIPAACASGSYNIVELYEKIKTGYLDAGIAGGAEFAINSHPRLGVGVFAASKVTSIRNDDPERASRPFDVDRDGFVPGSGGAVTVLASEDFANQHDLPIIGEILGAFNSMDARHVTALDPNNVARTMIQALYDEKNQVIYQPQVIGAHATSTKYGDPEEANAIREAFGDMTPNIAVTAIKGSLGHLMGGIGAVNFAIGCKVIEENVTPPIANLKNVDPEIAKHGIDFVMGQPREARVNVYLAGSYGFDNYTSAIAIGRYVK